ncbi:MAG: cob(I)yrinic acid a,c-diamide adenosyltransferase, partial [Streptosporangiaceae bacterium]
MTGSRIYTKTGDDGTTGLLHGGRVSKGDELVGAYGDIDEVIAALGAARAAGLEPRLSETVLRVQRELFAVAADLAANPRQRRRLVPGISLVTAEMTADIEQLIDALVAERPLRPVFVVPGATQSGALLDLARAVVRRAERHAVRARACGRSVSDEVLR